MEHKEIMEYIKQAFDEEVEYADKVYRDDRIKNRQEVFWNSFQRCIGIYTLAQKLIYDPMISEIFSSIDCLYSKVYLKQKE